MGSYCAAKGFFRKEEGMGGSIVNPTMMTSDDVFCEKCKVAADKIKKTPKSSSEMVAGGGTLGRHWNEVVIKCPVCGRTGVVDEGYRETDESYYSNEERRVYRIP